MTLEHARDYASRVATARWLRGLGRAFVTGAAVVFGLGAGVGSCGTSGSPPPGYVFQVREYAFPSGLRVVIEQDDTTPIAGAVLVVEAGDIDDPPGKSGLAHLVEHMVFRAPASNGLALWKTLPRLGASRFNASTGIERTTYSAFVPRTSLEHLVGALLARMGDPTRGIDDALFAKELSVVAEELRARPDTMARSRALAAILPPADPAAHVYAVRERLGALTLADIRAFADRRYRPEHMTLVISGAIGADWDQRLAGLLPAALRGQETVRRPPVRRPAPAPAAAATAADPRIPIVKTDVTGPELWMAWPLPATQGLQGVSFAVMARVADRVITERLEHFPSAALNVDVSVLTGSQASAFVCRTRLRSAADADRTRNEIARLMSSMSALNTPFGRGAVSGYQYGVRVATLQTAFAMENLASRALVRAAVVHYGSGAQVSEVIATLQKVSVEDVATFADNYLRAVAARAVLLVPDDTAAASGTLDGVRLRAASLPAETIGHGEPDVDDADHTDDAGDADVDGPAIASMASSPGVHRARVTTLANGLTVIAMRRPGLPFVSMLLGFHGEPQPGEVPGVRAALTQTPLWDLTPAPIDRGILHMTGLEPDSYQERLSLFSSDTGSALELIAEQPGRLDIHWPSARFARWVEREGQTDASPSARARRAFRTALLSDHAYRLAPTIDAARTVTGADVQTWLQRTRQPNNGALVIVGDVDMNEVSKRVESLPGSWKGAATPAPAPPVPPVPSAGRGPRPQVLFTHDPRRRSTEISFGCLLRPIHTFAADVRSDMLTDLIQDDLQRRLRFKLGASYAPAVRASTLRGGTALLEGTLDLADAALPDALDILNSWLDPTRPSPLKPAALERVRHNTARQSAFHNSSNARVAHDLFYVWNQGWPITVLDDYPKLLAQISADELAADLQACRASAVISVVGNGPLPPAAPAPPPN